MLLAGRAWGERLSRDVDFAPIRCLGAIDGLEGLRPSRTEQADKSKDFAAPHAERHVPHAGAPTQAAHRHGDFGRCGGRLRRHGARSRRPSGAAFPPQHGSDQSRARQIGGRGTFHHASVPQHSQPVAEPIAFRQAVADIDDAAAFLSQLLDDAVQDVDFGPGQCGRRLIHDDDLSAERDDPRDRDHLLQAEPQRPERASGIDREAIATEDRGGLRDHFRCIGEEAELPGLAREEDVGGDAPLRDQVDLLIDGGDARGLGGARAVEGDRLVVEQNLTRARLVEARQQLDQR